MPSLEGKGYDGVKSLPLCPDICAENCGVKGRAGIFSTRLERPGQLEEANGS